MSTELKQKMWRQQFHSLHDIKFCHDKQQCLHFNVVHERVQVNVDCFQEHTDAFPEIVRREKITFDLTSGQPLQRLLLVYKQLKKKKVDLYNASLLKEFYSTASPCRFT